MDMLLSDIAQRLNGQLQGEAAGISVTQISINTRTLQVGDLYLAIKGAQFDGNDFVADAEAAGACAAIVDKDVVANIPCIKVLDTRLALRELASIWRQMQSLSIVGITGSNGKTTVKEMMTSVLKVNASVLATQGNLNNDIGVPLTLFHLLPEHRFAVIEMGANHPGEIAYTSSCVQADVGIITNVGAAHIEGFGSIAGVAKAKGELIENLRPSGTAILNRDDEFFDFWSELAGQRKIISFGLTANADITAHGIVSRVENGQFITEFELVTAKGAVKIQLHLAGKHNVVNALAVSAAAVALGIELEQIKAGLEAMLPVKGRMQPVISLQGNIVINDTYNANPSSLKAALDVLLDCEGEPWVALGAFGELGADSQNIHAEMGRILKERGVMRLFATGSQASATVATFGAGAQFFAEQSDLIAELRRDLKKDAIVLCKGSRLQHMENVVTALCAATGN